MAINKLFNAFRFRNGMSMLLFLCFALSGFSFFDTARGETAEPHAGVYPTDQSFLHILPTVDQGKYALTLRLIDFDGNRRQNEFLLDSSSSHGTKAYPGLLFGWLDENGNTLNREGESIARLFDGAQEVNHLFLLDPLKTAGVWEFDSTQCFASLHGDSFALYRELGTIESGNTSLDHGQFLPFNDLKEGVLSSYHPVNLTDAKDEPLPDDAPRKGEPLYAIPANEANHYFGLTLDAVFTFPSSGTDDLGEDLIAYFTADDDLWVYIDGYLILDLGGIHSAVPGTINFSTGAVTYRGADGKDYTTKLYKLFRQRYEEKYPDARERDVQSFMNEIFTENSHWQTVFRGNTTHTLKLIYLERGAGASNLTIRFNLPVLEK